MNKKEIKKYLSKIGSNGGKARKENSTLEQRQEWGAKGGRPRNIDTLSRKVIKSVISN